MAGYHITFTRSARKELEALKDPLLLRIIRNIEALAIEPRPANCRKLTGADDLWRIRVGDYRILYTVQDKSRRVDVIAIRHRSDAYR